MSINHTRGRAPATALIFVLATGILGCLPPEVVLTEGQQVVELTGCRSPVIIQVLHQAMVDSAIPDTGRVLLADLTVGEDGSVTGFIPQHGVVVRLTEDLKEFRRDSLPFTDQRIGPLATAIVGQGDGSIVVWDASKQIVQVLNSEGAVVSSFTALGRPPYGLPGPLQAGGGLIAVGLLSVSTDSATERIAIFSKDGRLIRTLGPYSTSGLLMVRGEKFESRVGLPFDLTHRTQWTMDRAGRIWLANTESGDIWSEWPDSSGMRVRVSPLAVPVSGEDRGVLKDLGNTTGVTESALQEMLPPVKAQVLELLSVGPWLLVRRPISRPHTYLAVYDVLEVETGQFCGRFGSGARLLDATPAGRMVGTRATEDGNRYITVLSISARSAL